MRFTCLTLFGLGAMLPSVFGATQNVMVGMNGQLVFSPSNLTAAVGDTVNFLFMSPGKNHSATQSAFATPCDPLPGGANSGFLPVPSTGNFTTETAPTWSITVNTTTPLWIHCAQTNPKSHCQAGMVFSINATPEKSFEAFLANAQSSSSSSSTSASPATGSSSTSPPSSSSSDASTAANSSGSSSGSTSAAEDNQSPQTSGSLRITTSKRALGLFLFTSIVGSILI